MVKRKSKFELAKIQRDAIRSGKMQSPFLKAQKAKEFFTGIKRKRRS